MTGNVCGNLLMFIFSISCALKVWIDFLTPKQLRFTQYLSSYLEQEGYEVFHTTRHYAEVEKLCSNIRLPTEFVGSYGGALLNEKLEHSADRILRLGSLVNEKRPDIALSFGSPECARVAFGFGIPHICICDSPHADKVARLTIPLSAALATPWIIPKASWIRFGISTAQIIRYKTLDPAVWIKGNLPFPSNFDPETSLTKRRTITVRLEESKAAYLLSLGRSTYLELLQRLLDEFPDWNIVVMPRYEDQYEEIIRSFGNNVITPKDSVDGLAVLRSSNVFIGMGGTMTTEASLLGIPTISAYRGEPTYVEKFLIRKRLLERPVNLNELLNIVHRNLSNESQNEKRRMRAKRLMTSMEDPLPRISGIIHRFAR
jgi:hypothetical protein